MITAMSSNQNTITIRLKELFGNEKQKQIAEKLYTSQSNVSKWKRGKGFPGANTLQFIAERYEVSIDWLLGLSDEKEIHSVEPEEITYEQLIHILDVLLTRSILVVPNLNELLPEPTQEKAGSGDDSDDENETAEDESAHRDREYYSLPSDYADYLKVNDQAISFLLRRMFIVKKVGPEELDDAKKRWKLFEGIKLGNNNGNLQEYLASKPKTLDNYADLANTLRTAMAMTEEERQAELDKGTRKDVKDNE